MDRKIGIAFVLLFAFSIALSYAAYKFTALPFDQASYDEFHEEPRPLFSILMLHVSSLGDGHVPMVLTAAAIAIFAFRRQWLEAIFVLATTSSVLLAFALKAIIHRERPFPLAENTTGIIQSINQYSYPSGHVIFFVVFFGFFAYLAWMYFTGWMRAVAITTCAALIVLIGPSRVFLGAHWASDVVGSYIIGAIWLFVLILAYQLAKSRNCFDCKVAFSIIGERR
jgi:membrane-associated phospholipid phosphatase